MPRLPVNRQGAKLSGCCKGALRMVSFNPLSLASTASSSAPAGFDQEIFNQPLKSSSLPAKCCCSCLRPAISCRPRFR